MPQNIKVSKPSTVYVRFTGEMPKLFLLIASTGDAWYFRYMNGQCPRIKFNVPIAGEYTTNVDIEIVKIVDIEIAKNLPALPPPERDRVKNPTIIYDPSWTHTPASNFTEDGIIVHGPGWMALTPPLRLFIDLHEVGHFYYATEEYCDLYAMVNFLRMGYNRSTAYYALSMVLKRTPQAMNRVKEMFAAIVSATGEFSPE